MSEWKEIGTAPTDGSRVRVGHNLDPSSMRASTMLPTSGIYDEHTSSWHCSAAFVCVDGRIRWQPTHWLPTPINTKDSVNASRDR